jgi:phosphomevalonate decarboxylase
LAKATGRANVIQGLIKYHGLKDKKRRLPFHDSISVCANELYTTATVEFDKSYPEDRIEINGAPAAGREAERVLDVVNHLRKITKTKEHFKLASRNSIPEGKGLGFSAAAFASIAMAASRALNLNLKTERLSEVARLGAGSASRSVAGGFALWHANKNGRSYAEQLSLGENMKFAMAIVPIASSIKTDMAHAESVSSPFFKARVKEVNANLKKMRSAIVKGDLAKIGSLAEHDSLSLHAVTMTGTTRLFLITPNTIRIIERVVDLREKQGIPVWFSLDTGPSVWMNTNQESVDRIADDIRQQAGLTVLKSNIGGPAIEVSDHLF